MLISPLPSSKRLQYHFGESLKFCSGSRKPSNGHIDYGVEGSEHHGTFFNAGSYNPLTLISPSERILDRNGGIIAGLELRRMLNAVWFPLYHVGTSGHTVVEGEGVRKDNNGSRPGLGEVGPGSCGDIATGTIAGFHPSLSFYFTHCDIFFQFFFPLWSKTSKSNTISWVVGPSMMRFELFVSLVSPDTTTRTYRTTIGSRRA